MPKWLRSLALVLAVLGAATLLRFLPRASPKPKTPPAPKEILRFSLTSADLSLSLENVDGSWRVKTPIDVPANEGTVVGFLGSLRSLELEEVLSRRPESFSLYQLDDASGIRLKVWATGAQKPQEWVIGKDSPSGGHVYVRIGNDPEVYLAKGLSRSLAGTDLKTWRDSRILPLPPDVSIQSIRVHRINGNLILEKSSESWTVNGKTANQEKIDPLLASLRYLSADDFVDPPASGPRAAGLAQKNQLAAFFRPQGQNFFVQPTVDGGPEPTGESRLATAPTQITVTLSSGESHILRIGNPTKGDDSRALVRRDEAPHLMRINLRQMELIRITEKELLSK